MTQTQKNLLSLILLLVASAIIWLDFIFHISSIGTTSLLVCIFTGGLGLLYTKNMPDSILKLFLTLLNLFIMLSFPLIYFVSFINNF